MKNILVVQFRTRADVLPDEQEEYTRNIGNPNVHLVFKNAIVGNEDWNHPEEILQSIDGVILGGSGEFDFDGGRALDDEKKIMAHKTLEKLKPFYSHLFTRDIPTLGVCFGHQMLGAFNGARVINDKKQTKVGSHEVRLRSEGKNDLIAKDVPSVFVAQYGHKDSLDRVPSGAVQLMEGERCEYSALRYGKNIYTTQFHPELTAMDVIRKLSKTTGYLPEGVKAEDIVRQSPDATRILKNFISHIRPASSV